MRRRGTTLDLEVEVDGETKSQPSCHVPSGRLAIALGAPTEREPFDAKISIVSKLVITRR